MLHCVSCKTGSIQQVIKDMEQLSVCCGDKVDVSSDTMSVML